MVLGGILPHPQGRRYVNQSHEKSSAAERISVHRPHPTTPPARDSFSTSARASNAACIYKCAIPAARYCDAMVGPYNESKFRSAKGVRAQGACRAAAGVRDATPNPYMHSPSPPSSLANVSSRIRTEPPRGYRVVAAIQFRERIPDNVVRIKDPLRFAALTLPRAGRMAHG